MHLERVSFSREAEYHPNNLAMHLARYSIVQNICQGLDVLDIACGEGYGSFVMASQWGAKSVKGVDISPEAIESARKHFPQNNVEYICHEAERVTELFEAQQFDLIISLETIEHVNDDEKFLDELSKLLKPGGTLVISCPNDHWHYGEGDSDNPFHLKTYYFEEFKTLAEKYFGPATGYLFGQPLSGFGNFVIQADVQNDADNLKISSLVDLKKISSDLLPVYDEQSVEKSLYYVGVWGNFKSEEMTGMVMHQSLDQAQQLNEVIEAKNWLEKQSDNWQRLAEEREEQIAEITKGKDWLESQYNNWKKLAEAREEQIAEILEGKNWLESQYNHWKQIAEERESQIAQLSENKKNLEAEIENLTAFGKKN